MQINSTSSSDALGSSSVNQANAAQSFNARARTPDTTSTDQTAGPSQDDAVNISAAGAAAARADQTANANGANAANATQKTDATKNADPTLNADGTKKDDDSNPSVVKSFAYGALGLERPDEPKKDENSGYTAGKWLAAGMTIGGIIALLI